jgi:hypothetical protein
MDYAELDIINDKMDRLLQQTVDKHHTPHFYAHQLVCLYRLMGLHEDDYPIMDYTDGYKQLYFYDGLTTNKDLQTILRNKLMNIVKKYTRVYKLALMVNVAKRSINHY